MKDGEDKIGGLLDYYSSWPMIKLCLLEAEKQSKSRQEHRYIFIPLSIYSRLSSELVGKL